MTNSAAEELRNATERILQSESQKKLVVAGPGTGKTFLFRKLLEADPGESEKRLVLTFINNLKDDLKRSLGTLAQVYTLHGYCQYLLYRHKQLRGGLTAEFKCYPGLVSFIKQDWMWLLGSQAPEFVKEMRDLDCSDGHEAFYVERANYYDAVDFDDSVYRIFRQLDDHRELVLPYELVLIDEFQDFNEMEAGIIDLLADRNPIVIAGDDDQALYGQLRNASWEHIRSLYHGKAYEVFPLPFCMRCTEVIVEAVNDIIQTARAAKRLDGRIDKPFRFYDPIKGKDSRQYPKIDLVQTSVQRGNANYFGRYIERAVRAIPEADVREATDSHEPVALIIGSKPYLPQVEQHLIQVGLIAPKEQETLTEREKGLEILRENPDSNLGWRIILACCDESMAARRIRAAREQGLSLVDVIPEQERATVVQEAQQFEAGQEIDMEVADVPNDAMNIKLTSYEGSKGLSAQHVFLVGLHAGDLPRNPERIKDIEICRFVVGLTRTKKKCSLLLTRRFAGEVRRPSPFLDWIDPTRYEPITVNARYWRES